MVKRKLSPLKIVFYYLVFSLMWIILSDLLVHKITTDPAIYTTLSIIKGWLFVLVTSALLYWLIILYSKQRTRDEIALRESGHALQESRDQFRKVVEHSPLSMALVNSDGVIEYINIKAIETFGYLPQDIPDMDSWWVQAYPDKAYRDEVIARWMGLVGKAREHNREIEQREYRVTCKNGSVKIMLIFGVWIADKVLVIFDDITERKKVEESLRESETVYHNLFNNSEIAMFRTRLDGSEVLNVNEKFLELVGQTRDEIIGKPSLIHWVDPNRREEMVRLLKANGRVVDFELQMLDKKRGARDCLTSLNLYAEEGILDGSIVDITERKKLEQEILKTQKLESVGTLAGGIAHDFNNLLQGIFGYISLAKLTIDRKEESLSMLEEAEKALHQSVNLTTQLLTFSKGGKPVKKLINLAPVVENTVKFALSGSQTDYRIEGVADLRPVEADEGQLAQVIQNIVINASEAMAGRGTVTVALENADIPKGTIMELSEGGRFVRISIIDTGTGITQQNLAKIFDPYFTTKQMGSGLGLATSYSIIRNHSGIIQVKSRLSKGSRFTIYLPAADKMKMERVASAPQGDIAVTKGRVLFMDDEQIMRNVATEMLKALGHEVESAADGKAAIEMFVRAKDEGRPFDIVILDLTVKGGMGGEETIEQLREIDPGVTAVVSSGYSDNVVLATYHERGFSALLNKPYKIDDLRDCLNTLLK